MPTFTIEQRIDAAIVATLAAASGITTIGASVVKGFDAVTVKSIGDDGLVAVHCSGYTNAEFGLRGIQIAAPAYVSIASFTRIAKDKPGTGVQALAAAVSDVMADTAIVTTLNAAASGLHVYTNGVYLMDQSRDDGDTYRQITLQLEIHATVTS